MADGRASDDCRRRVRMPRRIPEQKSHRRIFADTQAIFENGSGECVTAARAAVFPPCAARAIKPPSTVATSRSHSGSCDVAA